MGLEKGATIGVIGAGQMGLGIAQVAATSGFNVIAIDQSQKALEKAQISIQKSLDKLTKKGLLTEDDQSSTLKRLNFHSDIQTLNDADLVIEAIVEHEPTKMSLWKSLDAVCKKSTIFTSNTSSIPITRMAAGLSRPHLFMGMHFMNPVPIMQLVELIPARQTSTETIETVTKLAKDLGKQTIIGQDFPGFVINRILVPMINEAFFALMEGIGTAEDIDKGLKLGCNFPMGPLKLADFVGLDTCLSILEVLHRGLGQPRYAACPLLRQYVDAGYLGVKVGRGVYTYTQTN